LLDSKHSREHRLSGSGLFLFKKELKMKDQIYVRTKVTATSAKGEAFNAMYFIKAAAAGGICCSLTHGAVTPMDVVKTREQLDQAKYNKGFYGNFRQIVAAEGPSALLTGLGATATGYFVQGWFKFGGVEFFKIKFANALGEQKSWENRTAIYLASSAMAEFIADLFLCPLEAVRIRSVSDQTFPRSLPAGLSHMFRTEGLTGFYAGLGPILFKQVPYTMAKFAVQGRAAEAIYNSMGKTPEQLSNGRNIQVSLLSGVLAGVVAAIISHPGKRFCVKLFSLGTHTH
jgi:solute carrier family 25 phosphate transporter 3